jgi:signal transduction histidine kinase/CheY-like chemotaxis protein
MREKTLEKIMKKKHDSERYICQIKILLSLLFYIFLTWLHRFAPSWASGIISQIQLLTSVFIVLSCQGLGWTIAFLLNLAQSLLIAIMVVFAGRTDATTGIFVPLVTIFLITVISRDRDTLWHKNKEGVRRQEELEKTRDAALLANEGKSRFLASVTHELRSPLSSVVGYLDLMEREPCSPTQREYLSIISFNARNLLNILNGLLDMSKIENQKMELALIPFNPIEVLGMTLKLFEPLAAKKQQRLEFTHNDIPVCLGDPLRLGQVIINLAGNAVKYSSEGSLIQLSILGEREVNRIHLRVSVSDNGPGIDEATQKKLFTPYEQGSIISANNYSGTGLGLSISANLVRLMGGKLELESSLGIGSRFYFDIALPPAIKTETHDTQLPDTLKTVTTDMNQSKKTILIADDTPDSLKLISLILRDAGFFVVEAVDGLKALDAYQKNTVDLIIMDSQMPFLSGTDTCCRIREMELATGRSPCPVIILSASLSTGERTECIEAGANLVLIKPVPAEELSLHITTLLAQSATIPKETSTADLAATAPTRNEIPYDHDYVATASEKSGLPEDVVADILREFVLRLPLYLQEIDAAFAPWSPGNLQKAAHRLKGGAASLWMRELRDAAAELEHLAEDGKKEDVLKQIY